MASALPTPLLMFLLAVMLSIMLISSMARNPAIEVERVFDKRTGKAAAAPPPPLNPLLNKVTIVTDPRCHPAEHTGYAGDGAVVWGLGNRSAVPHPTGFHLPDAASCCRACQAHNEVCGKPGAQGSKWWPGRPDMHCGGDISVACTIWTYCPVERCFAFDIHKHEARAP